MTRRQNPGGRNLSIDLMKFIYSWFIVFHHFYVQTGRYLVGGYNGVEFFLIAAGIFFFKAIERDESAPPHRYLRKRFMRFLPWSTTAFIFAFFVRRVVISGHTFRQLVNDFSKDIWELLLISMNGFNGNATLINTPVWTISAMLLVEIVMVGCLFCNKKAFVHVFIPTTLIIGFGLWRNLDDASAKTWIGFTTFGVLHAWLVYGCSYYCLRLSDYLKAIHFNTFGKAAMTVLETACHGFAIWGMLYASTRNYQWCTILAFMIAISVEVSGHSIWDMLLNKLAGVVKFLGGFSLSVFLMHYPVVKYFEYLYPDTNVLYAHVGQCAAVIIAASAAHYLITTGLILFWRRNGTRIKGFFLENDVPAADARE